MALEQEIIELVGLSAAESVRDMGFSSPWISIGSGSLIRIKSVSKLAKYFGQLFISIIAPTGFRPWVSRRCWSISYIIVSTRISGSILPIRIVVHRDNTWARNRRNCSARLNCARRRPQRWMASLMDSSWVLWHIWQISHLVTEMQDHVKECPKWWDWSWRVTVRGSYLEFKVWIVRLKCRQNCDRVFSRQNCSEATANLESDNTVRHGSHQSESSQNGLRDKQTCGMTLASAYVLHRLSAVWSQLQIMGRKSKWEWVLIGVSPLNTGDWV